MNRDEEVADDLANNYQPRRAKPAGVEVPVWFLIWLSLVALTPTLSVVVYAIVNG